MLHCYTKPFGLKENTVLIPVEFFLHQYKLRTEQKELKLNRSVSDDDTVYSDVCPHINAICTNLTLIDTSRSKNWVQKH